MGNYTKGDWKQYLPCGCKIFEYSDKVLGIDYCPKHKAAPDMYEALKSANLELCKSCQEIIKMAENEGLESYPCNKICELRTQIEKALAKAEGKE